MFRFILLAGGLAFLTSCALTEKQCQEGNWRGIGLNDGKNGRDLDHVANHVKACSKHGITVDEQLWALGRAEGLETYCTPRSAYESEANGRNFKVYNCPESAQGELSNAAKQGERYYDISRRIARLDSERDRLYSELANLPADQNNAGRRGAIRLEISRINFEIRQLVLDRTRYSRY